MRFLLATIVIAMFLGCTGQRDGSNVPRLSETKVIDMADDFAKKQREKYEPFDLKFYPNRKAEFDKSSGIWWVHYWREPNRWPGDHFTIQINDRTGDAKYIGGR